MKNIPNRIYLQCGEDLSDNADFNELRCITWTTEKVFDNDIEYILKPAKAKKSIAQMAKETNGRSMACMKCRLLTRCTLDTAEICSNSFVEGYTKGYKQARKG